MWLTAKEAVVVYDDDELGRKRNWVEEDLDKKLGYLLLKLRLGFRNLKEEEVGNNLKTEAPSCIVKFIVIFSKHCSIHNQNPLHFMCTVQLDKLKEKYYTV